MIRRETSFILLLASACTSAHFPPKPELPASISPSWILKSLDKTERPPADCWSAIYGNASGGSAEALVCGYTSDAGALDAIQKAQAAANTVKFQEGRRVALVKWNGAGREDVKALVISIQKSIR